MVIGTREQQRQFRDLMAQLHKDATEGLAAGAPEQSPEVNNILASVLRMATAALAAADAGVAPAPAADANDHLLYPATDRMTAWRMRGGPDTVMIGTRELLLEFKSMLWLVHDDATEVLTGYAPEQPREVKEILAWVLRVTGSALAAADPDDAFREWLDDFAAAKAARTTANAKRKAAKTAAAAPDAAAAPEAAAAPGAAAPA